MVAVRKKRPEKLSVPLSVTWGSIAAIAVSLVLSGVLAFLVFNGKIKEEYMEIFVCIILFFASCIGGVISAGLAKERVALLSMVTSVVFIIVLLAFNILIFGAGFSNLVINALAICVGGIIATLLLIGKRPKKRHR